MIFISNHTIKILVYPEGNRAKEEQIVKLIDYEDGMFASCFLPVFASYII